MDIKNDISAGKILGILDGIVEKIPDPIASILKKIAIVILIVLLLYSAFRGWQKGSGLAEPEGQKIAEDTRSLFYEDLEKAYNRKKKNIQFSEMNEEVLQGQNYKKEYEYYSEKPAPSLVKEKPDLLQAEKNGRLDSGKERKATRPEIMDTIKDTENQVIDQIDKKSFDLPGKMTPEDESELKEKSDFDIIKPKKKKLNSDSERKRKLLMPEGH